MSKLSNTLLMLFTLQKGGMHSIKDLSELLEVTPRQVRRYREDLEKSGVFVHSKTGKYGGYYLDDAHKTLKINVQDENSDQLFSMLFQDEYAITMEDIAAMYAMCLQDKTLFRAVMAQNNLPAMKAYVVMHYAMRRRRPVKVHYMTKKYARLLELTVQPYTLFSRFGNAYVAAVDAADGHMKYYRLSRMHGFSIVTPHFAYDQALCDQHKAIIAKNDGVFYRGDWVDVELTCAPEFKAIIEDVFGGNLVFVAMEDAVHVTMTVGSEDEIFHRLLGFGSAVMVLQPKTLAHRLKQAFEKAAGQYD